MLAYISSIYSCTEFGECFVLRMAHTALSYIRTALLHMSMSRHSAAEFRGVRESWTSSLTDLKAGRLGVLGHHPDKNGRNDVVRSDYPGYNGPVGLGTLGGWAGG